MYVYKKIASIIVLTAVSMTLISCAGHKSAMTSMNAAPPLDAALRSELKKELSTLYVSVEATAQELSDTLNRLTPKTLYKGSTKTKGLSADILRNGPIAVTAADNYIYVTIPVSLALSYAIFETPPITSKLKFRLTAKVTPDWKINADVYYTGLGDLLVEDAGIGPISIKPRGIVEGVIQPVQRTVSELINRKLNENFPLKNEVNKAWNAAQKPILLDKQYNAWLKIVPRDVLLNPLHTRDNRVQLSVGLTTFADVVVGPEPPAAKPLPLPNLKLVQNGDKSFRVALHTDLYYKDLLAIATPLLINKELGSDGKSVILRALDIYGNGDRLMIKVTTNGDLDGTFYLTCRPVFNPENNRFSVEDVDFDMQTQSLLLSSADWFLHGAIRSRIQEKLNMDLGERLTQLRELASKAMAHVKLADNLFLNGSIKSIRLNDVMVQRDRLSIQVYTDGEAAILLH